VIRFAQRLLDWFGDVLFLIMRGYWGFVLARTGLGKLNNLERTAGFFESLHIPMPHANAMIAGCTELVGGTLLMVGLGARPASVPVAFTMCIALATAFHDELMKLFQDPDKVIGADPFLFLLVATVVLAHGPGMLSLDALGAWLARRVKGEAADGWLRLWVGRSTAERLR